MLKNKLRPFVDPAVAISNITEADIDRFHAMYIPIPECGCWIWERSEYATGYGAFNIKRKPVRAHRVSWYLHNGFISNELVILHKCDVPLCVNPDHLVAGSHVDNVKDMCSKNRQARGIRHGSAKLDDAKVRLIRELRPTHSVSTLCKMFGVGIATIVGVANRTRWSHIN